MRPKKEQKGARTSRVASVAVRKFDPKKGREREVAEKRDCLLNYRCSSCALATIKLQPSLPNMYCTLAAFLKPICAPNRRQANLLSLPLRLINGRLWTTQQELASCKMPLTGGLRKRASRHLPESHSSKESAFKLKTTPSPTPKALRPPRDLVCQVERGDSRES